jgi:hypothetical protein
MSDGTVAVAALKRRGDEIENLANNGFGMINVGHNCAEDGDKDYRPVQTPLDAKDG